MNEQSQVSQPTIAVDDLLHRADDFVRQEPTRAVASAFGIGFLLNLLPLATIVGALVSLAFTLARPVLLCLGLLKAFELYQSKIEHSTATHE